MSTATTTYVVHKTDPPTAPQIWRVGKEGGDQALARSMNREECSQYISRLIEKNKGGCPPPVPSYISDQAVPEVPREVATEVPTVLLDMVPNGRFALRLDESHPWVFLRKSQPKSGHFEGCIKLQSKHGPNWSLCYVVWPDGKISWYERQYKEELKLLLVAHRRAGVDFGRKLRKCQICGLDLTDPRSRKYSIGPDCEENHPEVIAYVDGLIAAGEIEDVDD